MGNSTHNNARLVREKSAIIAAYKDRAKVADLLRFEVRDAVTYSLVEKLDGGEVLDLDELNVASFNILARAQQSSGVINSVVFSYNGVPMSVRNVPNLLWMCDGACNLEAGEVTLSATPFSGPNGTGMAGKTQTVTFTHSVHL